MIVAAAVGVAVIIILIPWNRVLLRLPGIDKASCIAENIFIQTTLRTDALQGAIGAPECEFAPIMRREVVAAGTARVGAHVLQRSAKPSVGEFVTRWRFFGFFGMRRQNLVHIVQFLPVHVRVRSHRTTLHRTIRT